MMSSVFYFKHLQLKVFLESSAIPLVLLFLMFYLLGKNVGH